MKTLPSTRALLAVLFLLPLGACFGPRGASGPGLLEQAALAEKGGATSPRQLALAGFAASLLDSNSKRAVELWTRAAASEDPWALWGLAENARRTLDLRGRVGYSVRLCNAAPRHPLCAAAARACLGSLGESPALDAAIEAGALQVLQRGAAGEAAFLWRIAAAEVRRNRHDLAGASALFADSGSVSQAALWGPYSRFHYLDWQTAFPPEKGEAGAGAFGPIPLRSAASPDGRYSFAYEGTPADIEYWASDVQVAREGVYLARVAGRASYKLFVDGAPAFERRDFEDSVSEHSAARVRLAAGRHRLLLKVARGSERGDIAWALYREDGAPAQLSFFPASGPTTAPAPKLESAPAAYVDAASFAAALESEVGGMLADYVAARDAVERDPHGAKLLASALAERRPSAALLVLRGETLLADRSLPARIASGRANRDFDAALKLDPGEAWALQRLSVYARAEGRFDQSQELLEKAIQVASPSSWRPVLSQMRLAQARGVDSLAEEAARRALQFEPGLCEALSMRSDLARKREAVGEAQSLLEQMSACPGYLRALADQLRSRGELERARETLEKLRVEAPLDPAPILTEAQVLLAQDKPKEAAALLAQLEAAWPRAAIFHKRRADALERAGDAAGARAEREAALLLDGSDLKLRRALAALDGKELLDDLRQDGPEHIAAYRKEAPPESSAAAYLLDSSAVEAYPDGSFVERTHVVAKVVDQRGVDLLAEVHLPSGAEPLSLRTLKADGRVLEPEAIGGKDGISLPGVEVGDLVEYEYLNATGARGPASPGFAAPKFYFRIADGQLFHSIYAVRAPVGSGLEIDAHQMTAPAPEKAAAGEQVVIERRGMPPFIREPGATSLDEVMPFVQIGTGAGTAEMLAGFGDFLLDRTRLTPELVKFAKDAAQGLTGEAAVRAVYEKVMTEIKGQEGSLTSTAAGTLAQGRGSRTLLLKAAFDALGIRCRLLLVRPFSADPAKYRFPAAELYGYPALRVELAKGAIDLNPGVRFAPFGVLSPAAQQQEAALLPEPGETVQMTRTGGDRSIEPKLVRLSLSLSEDGTLSGEGEETYQGLDAAYLRQGLERLDSDQRRQAIEASIGRNFANAALAEFSIDAPEKSGAPVALRYRFTAYGAGRLEGGRLALPNGLFPVHLGRRFLALSERKLPMLVSDPDRLELTATIALPKGFALAGPPQAAKIDSPFGAFEHQETSAPGLLTVRETLSTPMQRVAPEQYPAFGQFASSVDQAQTRPLVFEGTTALPPQASR